MTDAVLQLDNYEPHPLPPPAAGDQLLKYAIQQITTIANSSVFAGDSCTACLAGLEVAKFLALAAPEQGPNLAVALCEAFDYADDCATWYSFYTFGTPITQVIAYADVGGYDGQVRGACRCLCSRAVIDLAWHAGAMCGRRLSATGTSACARTQALAHSI